MYSIAFPLAHFCIPSKHLARNSKCLYVSFSCLLEGPGRQSLTRGGCNGALMLSVVSQKFRSPTITQHREGCALPLQLRDAAAAGSSRACKRNTLGISCATELALDRRFEAPASSGRSYSEYGRLDRTRRFPSHSRGLRQCAVARAKRSVVHHFALIEWTNCCHP